MNGPPKEVGVKSEKPETGSQENFDGDSMFDLQIDNAPEEGKEIPEEI